MKHNGTEYGSLSVFLINVIIYLLNFFIILFSLNIAKLGAGERETSSKSTRAGLGQA